MLQLKECIIPPFKIDLNFFAINKSIKIKVPAKGNQNTHKGETKIPIKGTTKIPTDRRQQKSPQRE